MLMKNIGNKWVQILQHLTFMKTIIKKFGDCFLSLFQQIFVYILQGVTVDQTRINAINKLADKLINQGRMDTAFVKDKRDSLNTK